MKDCMGRWVTRQEIIESLRELHELAMQAEKARDPGFKRWPDAELMLDHIEQHGLPRKG